jgi:FkbM family methyltransferase
MLIPLDYIFKKYEMDITGIIHIGAHLCEELNDYLNCNVGKDKIIWVEANPKLVEINKKIDPKRKIKNFICCDTDEGYTRLNITNNSASSSILDLGSHLVSYPSVKYIGSVNVKNKRLDTMYKEEQLPYDFANFLSIDIQGAELLALKGMGDLLKYYDYLYLEINKDYVYKNCCLVNEIDDYLKNFNFERVETKWTTQNWGDGFYVKKNLL